MKFLKLGIFRSNLELRKILKEEQKTIVKQGGALGTIQAEKERLKKPVQKIMKRSVKH